MTTIPLQQATVSFGAAGGAGELVIEGLRVRFKVTNAIGHDADDAVIQISNLTPGTAATIRRFQGEQVELNINGSTLDICNLYSVRDRGRGISPTTTTEITLRDTRLHTIPINALISRHLGGLPFGIERLARAALGEDAPVFINVSTEGYEDGITVRGRFESFFDFLQQFNPPVPISVSRNKDAWYIFTDSGDYLANPQTLLHSDVLTYAQPEEREENGIPAVRADILLNHYVKIGDVVQFHNFTGMWRVISLIHSGDTHGSEFKTRVTAIDHAYMGLLNPDEDE